MAALAILCPGQASQHAQMFDLPAAAEQLAAQLDAWWPAGGATLDWRDLLHQPEAMQINRHAQPLVVSASLLAWHWLQPVLAQLPPVQLVVGYSVGEISASVVSGIFTPLQAMALVRGRAASMDRAADGPAQAMAALTLPAAIQASLLDDLPFALAIENGARQWVVGGQKDALPYLQQRVLAKGGTMQVLPVQVAAHTHFLQPAVAPFLAALQQQAGMSPQCVQLMGVSAQMRRAVPLITGEMAQAVAAPVRWAACMEAMQEAGITLALELGPGSALTAMLRQHQPQMEARAVGQFRSLAGLQNCLQRHFDP